MKRAIHEIQCLKWTFKTKQSKRIQAATDLSCSAIAELGDQDLKNGALILPAYAKSKGTTVEKLIQRRLIKLGEMHQLSLATNILVALFVIILVGSFFVIFLRIAQTR